MVDNIHGTFISQKVNKVRWKPEVNLDSETFLTGSWDNEVSFLLFLLSVFHQRSQV